MQISFYCKHRPVAKLMALLGRVNSLKVIHQAV